MAEDDFIEKVGDFLSRKARNLRDRLTFDETDLIRAVGKNIPDEVDRVLAAGVNPNKADIIGRRALTMAVDGNDLSIVESLLEAGADPNLAGKDSLPLTKAIFWENIAIIEALLEAGADPSIQGPDGKSPASEAQSSGANHLVALIQNFKGKRKEKQIEQDKKLHEKQKAQAEKAKLNRAKVEKEIQKKAQADAQAAALAKYPDAVKFPLRALIKAIKAQDENAIALLMLSVEDLNQLDSESKTTALLAAIETKNSMATGLLLEKGSDPLMIPEGMHHSGFSQAVRKKAYGLVAHILERYPEKAKVAMNESNVEISPQFMAYKDPKLFNLLLKGGADPFFGGKEGQAPVIKAIAKGGIGILPVLTRHAVDINQEVEGKTLLQWSIFHNRLDWVQGLIAEGAEMSQAIIDETEKLSGRDEIVEFLKKQL